MTLTKTLSITLAVGAALLPSSTLAQVDPIQNLVTETGEASASASAAATSAIAQLADVKNVQVTPGEASVTLSWDAVAGADGYTVYYDVVNASKNENSYKNKKMVKETRAIIDGLTAGTTYYFAVAAEDSTGTKLGSANYSTEVSATPTETMHGSASVANTNEVSESMAELTAPVVSEPIATDTVAQPATAIAQPAVTENQPTNLPKSGPEVILLGFAAAGIAAVRRRFFQK